MKKKILIITTTLLILAGGFSSCKDKNELVEIPFTEYSLIGTQCQWTNLDYNGKVIIINSSAELEKYIDCVEGIYPEIDFSKWTLLLAHGMENHLVYPKYKSLQQHSTQSYVMKVNLEPAFATVITYWQVPIIVNKIADDVVIELIVTKNP